MESVVTMSEVNAISHEQEKWLDNRLIVQLTQSYAQPNSKFEFVPIVAKFPTFSAGPYSHSTKSGCSSESNSGMPTHPPAPPNAALFLVEGPELISAGSISARKASRSKSTVEPTTFFGS